MLRQIFLHHVDVHHLIDGGEDIMVINSPINSLGFPARRFGKIPHDNRGLQNEFHCRESAGSPNFCFGPAAGELRARQQPGATVLALPHRSDSAGGVATAPVFCPR